LEVIHDLTHETSAGKELKRMPSKMQMGVSTLPALPRDFSDRNRTSPFAFTGNKFEFRAVGSSQSCARPAMFLNTIVADSISFLADQIENSIKQGLKREIAVHKVVVDTLKEHQRVVFNGNGYSEEWVQEAKKRGLPNLRTYPEAIEQLISEKNVKLFTSTGVLSKKELESQQHIAYENYSKVIAVESGVMLHMINGSIIPAVFEYKQNLKGAITADNQFQTKYFTDLDNQLTKLLQCAEELKSVRSHAAQFDEHHLHDQAQYYRQQVTAAMETARTVADSLELMVDDKLWPFPKYPEMLFLK